MSSSTSGNNEFRCNECGITFTTVQDKEEHMKLEHRESKGPAGVKWAYNAQSNQGQEPTHTSSSWVPRWKKLRHLSSGVQASCLLFLAPQTPLVLPSAWSESFTYYEKWMHKTYVGTDWLTHLIRSLPVHEILHCSNHTLLFVGGAANTQRLHQGWLKISIFHTISNITSPCYPIISAARLLFSNK